MNYKNHYIELLVNGEKVELESQDSLNMRFNTVLFDPTKIAAKRGEYSFEFEVPATPKNNTIFNYANNSAAENKFNKRYNAYVYADGDEIFKGSLTVNSYEDGYYSVNLVQMKTNSVSEIFGDMRMNEISWEIPFYGVRTMNEYNASGDKKIMFPLVSYGAFAKTPYEVVDGDKHYTSKFVMDEWNRWYMQDFYPSLNVMETMKKAFETKGYTVGGDALTDPLIGDIFASTNLANEQVPLYNIGQKEIGKVNLSVAWQPHGDGYPQDLKYPYLRVGGNIGVGWDGEKHCVTITESHQYNFSSIQLYNMLKDGSVTAREQPEYLYDSGEGVIVIPASGYYRIHLDISSWLSQNTSLYATQWTRRGGGDPQKTDSVEIPPNFLVTMPLEIQLVKNYDDNVELIKGKDNMDIANGILDGNYTNYYWYEACFPHEKLGYYYHTIGGDYQGGVPTVPDTLTAQKDAIDYVNPHGKLYKEMDCRTISQVMHVIDCQSNHLMGYDPVVNPNFIMGFSSMGRVNEEGEDWSSAHGGVASVIKNGKSWSVLSGAKNQLFYTWGNPFQWNPNPQGGVNFRITQGDMSGGLDAIVHLDKGDILNLFAIHRDYSNYNGESLWYSTYINANLEIEAVSPKDYDTLRQNNELVWDETDQKYESAMRSKFGFPRKLQLGEFMNKETKVSDWIEGIKNAFNLEIVQDGNNIFINKVKTLENHSNGVVDLNDKINIKDAKFEKINYPSSMSVKYKIDTDEWGFERSAVAAAGRETILDEKNWKDWGDSGYTKIILNTDEYVASTSDVSLPFSYTWYDAFSFRNPDGSWQAINIPVISKYSYMIDGYSYNESRKHNGYGQAQRFWFSPKPLGTYVWTKNIPSEQVFIYLPQSSKDGIDLSYKANGSETLLTQLFNEKAYLSSNIVELDVYLNSDEYNRIRNGSYVAVDTDVFIPLEVEGYDPSGNDTTSLKLMKKI